MKSIAAEQRRLQELMSFGILDTLPEPEFDRITKLVARVCQVPIALVSLVDDKRQWFKSAVGIDACETDRDIAFCAHAIQGTELFVVPDAQADPRFANNPLVTGEPHVRFYAGVPLISNGKSLGTLCAIDRVPRTLTQQQVEVLHTLAELVMEQLELRRQHGNAAEDTPPDYELATLYALSHSKRAYKMLQSCNEAMLRTEDEDALLTAICRVAVESGGYQFAWIGYAQNDDYKSILPVAHDGIESWSTVLNQLNLSWSAEQAQGQGAAGRAIRSGQPVQIADVTQDPSSPVLQIALQLGFRGLACLPLREGAQNFGLLCLVSEQALNLPTDELNLLQQMVDNLAFGIMNIRAKKQQQQANLKISEQATLLDEAKDAIIVRGLDNRIQFWNKGAERLYGWTAAEAQGKQAEQLLHVYAAESRLISEQVLAQGEWRGELRQRHKDGSWLIIEGHWTLIADAAGQPKSMLSINTDISLRKSAENKIQQLAFYDQLTTLPNRRLLLDRLQQVLATNARSKHKGALLFIDLDNFKNLNDTKGHDVGDLMLQEVGRRLVACVRESDTVARLGGDEFVVMLVELDNTPREAAAQAEIVGEKILVSFEQPFQLAGYSHHATPSIGATLINEQLNSDELLKQADLALYRAKATGRNKLCFYDREMQSAITTRVALETELRLALLHSQFLLHYQPQLGNNGGIMGAEALLRWQHPERGMIFPAEFIPVAEANGLILQLGHWVLENACAQLAAWAKQPETATLSISVNVSARQFRQADFVEQVLATLHNAGDNPQRLKLELTESLLLNRLDMDGVIAKMLALKTHHVSFALDDFGTGYSSLSYLQRLPFDELKIDQSFIKDMLTDARNAAIARTIIALGHSMGMSVLAEGVETEAQRAFLKQYGCHAHQGYLYSRPLPIQQFEAFLRADVNLGQRAMITSYC